MSLRQIEEEILRAGASMRASQAFCQLNPFSINDLPYFSHEILPGLKRSDTFVTNAKT